MERPHLSSKKGVLSRQKYTSNAEVSHLGGGRCQLRIESASKGQKKGDDLKGKEWNSKE